jgi:hypothetical protein
MQFAHTENFMLFGMARPDYGIRASGHFPCPNHLGGYLEVIVAMALATAPAPAAIRPSAIATPVQVIATVVAPAARPSSTTR